MPTPHSARAARFNSLITQHRTQVTTTIAALQASLSHETAQSRSLHTALTNTINTNTTRRMQEFQRRRAGRHRVFTSARVRRDALAAEAARRWEARYAADMDAWTRDLEAVARMRRQAFKEERASWRWWAGMFHAAHESARQVLEELRWRYQAAHVERAGKLEFAHRNHPESPARPTPPSSSSDDEETSRSAALAAELSDAAQRWSAATSAIKTELDRSRPYFNALFRGAEAETTASAALCNRLYNSDRQKRQDEHTTFCTACTLSRTKHEDAFETFLAAASAAHRAQLDAHARSFRAVVDPVEQMLQYWRTTFVAVREKQRMHSQNFFELYQRVLRGDVVEHATYDEETARHPGESARATAPETATELATPTSRWSADEFEFVAEERASSRISSMDSRALEPSEASFSNGSEHPEINESPDVADTSPVDPRPTDRQQNNTEIPPVMPNDSPAIPPVMPNDSPATPNQPCAASPNDDAENDTAPARPAPLKRILTAAYSLFTTALTSALHTVTHALALLVHSTPRDLLAEWEFQKQQAARRRVLRADALVRSTSLAHWQGKIAASFADARAYAEMRAEAFEVYSNAVFASDEEERRAAHEEEKKANHRAHVGEAERQERVFGEEQAGRGRRVAECVKEMREGVERPRAEREELCAEFLDELHRFVREQVELFEEEERARQGEVEEMISSTMALLRQGDDGDELAGRMV
ncbi:hypothetical protein C0993_009555 [Termitomyces sp. T159_Od127]|nr:hypothetical protein C0993_009555 [Termitomyces sp. T159_Od127]